MGERIQKTTVKAIFKKDGKVLFVRDPKGIWELPGGRIEHGESPEQALKRELDEELGWTKIDITKIIDAWSFTSETSGKLNHFIILIYACTSKEKNIKKNDEYTEYKWLPISKIDTLEMRDGYKNAIRKFLLVGPSA